MSKYTRSRPQHEEVVDSDIYAFDRPSDYLAFDGSEFATPREYLKSEEIKREAFERDRLLAERLEQERFQRDCLEKKRIRQENMLLQYREFFSLNIFSNLDEFYEFVEDFYGKNWSSNHPSRISIDSDDYRYAIQELALNEVEKQPRHFVSRTCRPSLSYERELTEKYLNGDIGEEPDDAKLFGLDEFSDGDFYDVDTNEAFDAHIEEKSRHADRRMRNVRATNRLVSLFHEGTENSFVLNNAKAKPCEHHEMSDTSFICKKYQEVDKKLDEYDSIVAKFSEDKKAAKIMGDAVLSPLNRKRCAETIRRFKRPIRLAKHYGSFSSEDGRYLKKEAPQVSSVPAVKKRKDKKVPMQALDYVNHRFGKPQKVSKCSSQKKLLETAINIIAVPFRPCHIAPSFARH